MTNVTTDDPSRLVAQHGGAGTIAAEDEPGLRVFGAVSHPASGAGGHFKRLCFS